MKNVFFTWIGILLVGCEAFTPFKNIELNELSFGDQSNAIELFVTGGLTSQMGYHQLKIERPGNILNGQQSQIITDVTPYIISDLDTIKYVLIDTVGQPFFKTSTITKAELGKKYTLCIEYNNKIFTATDSIIKVEPFEYEKIELPNVVTNVTYEGMPDLISLDLKKHEFGYEKANMWSWVSFSIYDRYSKDESYLNFENGKTYTHWASDPNAIFSYYTYHSGLGPFVESDTLLTAKYSISDGYYQYLLSLFAETDWKQGEFATQPGNLPTNFSKGAAGYFFVSDMYEKQIVVGDLLELIEN